MTVEYRDGDLLASDCGIKCHQVNCKGVMGAGIAKQVKEKYCTTFRFYRERCSLLGSALLGTVQCVSEHDGSIIANIFGQDDHDSRVKQTVDWALKQGIREVYSKALETGRTAGFPNGIGCVLGGGDWNEISQFIEDTFAGPEVKCYIYKFDPRKGK